jgi:hypothetical protein
MGEVYRARKAKRAAPGSRVSSGRGSLTGRYPVAGPSETRTSLDAVR